MKFYKAFTSTLLLVIAFSFISFTLKGQTIKSVLRDNLRVGTVNLLHDFPKFTKVDARLDLIADEIRRHDIDIFAVQEAFATMFHKSTVRRLAKRLGYYYRYRRTEGHRWLGFEHGMGIISRYPFTGKTRKLTFRSQAHFYERRAVVRAVIKTPFGPVTMFAVHLSFDKPGINIKQMNEVRRYIKKRPPVGQGFIAGDFNADPEFETIQSLTIDDHAVDAWAMANPNASFEDSRTCCTCIMLKYSNKFDPCPVDMSLFFQERIDYVFKLPNDNGEHWDVTAASTFLNPVLLPDGRWLRASDHLGVFASFKPQIE